MPAITHHIIGQYSQWLSTNTIPKLFINAEPGAVVVGKTRDFIRSWAKQDEVTVKGIHFIQEDSPNEIGQAISAWLKQIGN